VAGKMKEAPVLRPTWEEFQDFSGYIQKIRAENPGVGIVKIVPPAEWHPNLKPLETVDDIVIPVPVEQKVIGEKGTYQVINEERPQMTVRDFKAVAQQKAVAEIEGQTDDEVERKFWKNLPYSTTYYGADMVRLQSFLPLQPFRFRLPTLFFFFFCSTLIVRSPNSSALRF
jgi:[histone H3]-trimethyl-L-lysine9/36 demethylase